MLLSLRASQRPIRSNRLSPPLKPFQPAVTEGELSSLFMIPEMGETNHGKPISASAIQSCDLIWSDEAAALLIAVASPPTEATRSCVGVLFLLVRRAKCWHIADILL